MHYSLSRLKTVFVFLVFYYIYSTSIWGGNMVEEYILPLSLACLYLAVKSDRHFLFYGICLGICIFTKLTCGAFIGGIILYNLSPIIREKQFKTALRLIGFILLGTLVVTIPILIYHFANGTLNDMLFWCFRLAFRRGVTDSSSPYVLDTLEWNLLLSPCFIGLIYGYILYKQGLTDRALLFIYSSVLLYISLQLGSHFNYYTTSLLPLLILILVSFVSEIPATYNIENPEALKKHLIKLFIMTASVTFIGLAFFPSFTQTLDSNFKTAINSTGVSYNTGYRTVASMIPEDERDDIMCLNFGTRFFVANHLLPANKYPINYPYFGSLYPPVRTETLSVLKNANYKWIFVEINEHFGFNDEEVLDLLGENYEQYFEYGQRMLLFKKLENK